MDHLSNRLHRRQLHRISRNTCIEVGDIIRKDAAGHLPLQAESTVGSNLAISSALHLDGTQVLSAATTFSALHTQEISRTIVRKLYPNHCPDSEEIIPVRYRN